MLRRPVSAMSACMSPRPSPHPRTSGATAIVCTSAWLPPRGARRPAQPSRAGQTGGGRSPRGGGGEGGRIVGGGSLRGGVGYLRVLVNSNKVVPVLVGQFRPHERLRPRIDAKDRSLQLHHAIK